MVLGISRDWSQRFRLRGAEVSTVATPVPVVRVVAFEVEGAADFGGQDFVVGQIRCILRCRIGLSSSPPAGGFGFNG